MVTGGGRPYDMGKPGGRIGRLAARVEAFLWAV